MVIESRVAGIPCQIAVNHFFVQKPLGRSADSDLDCDGYVEMDWEVLDRRGYPAKWLEKKLNDLDRERIENEIWEKSNELLQPKLQSGP